MIDRQGQTRLEQLIQAIPQLAGLILEPHHQTRSNETKTRKNHAQNIGAFFVLVAIVHQVSHDGRSLDRRAARLRRRSKLHRCFRQSDRVRWLWRKSSRSWAGWGGSWQGSGTCGAQWNRWCASNRRSGRRSGSCRGSGWFQSDGRSWCWTGSWSRRWTKSDGRSWSTCNSWRLRRASQCGCGRFDQTRRCSRRRWWWCLIRCRICFVAHGFC